MQENNNNNEVKNNENDTIVIKKEEIDKKMDDTKENMILNQMKKEVQLDKMKNESFENTRIFSNPETENKQDDKSLSENKDEDDLKIKIEEEKEKPSKQESKKNRKEAIKSTGFSFFALIAVLLLFGFYTFYISKGFDSAPWEVYNTYTQTDNFSIAKIYELKGVDFFRPQIFYDGAKEHIVKREPQIYTVLSVMLSSFLNIKLELALRYVSYAFFLMSSIYFYKISRLFFDRKFSVASLFVYMMMPISICISRAIMIDTIVLFFYLAAVYYAFVYFKEEERDYSYISSIFLSFAMLMKFPAVFFVILAIYLFFKKYSFKALKKPEFYMYIIISIIPSIIYNVYVSMICDVPFSKTLSKLNIFSGFFNLALNRYTLSFHLNSIRESFGMYIFVLAAIGFITLVCRRKNDFLLSSLTVFTCVEVLLVSSVYKQVDQYVFLIPVFALLIASFVNSYMLNIEKLLIFLLIFSSLFYFSYKTVNTKFVDDENIAGYKQTVDNVLDKNAKVAVNTDNRAYISCLERWGARLSLKYYPYVPDDDKLELKYWIDDGITNIILLRNGVNYSGFSEHIKEFADRIYSDSDMDIYKVKKIEDIVYK